MLLPLAQLLFHGLDLPKCCIKRLVKRFAAVYSLNAHALLAGKTAPSVVHRRQGLERLGELVGQVFKIDQTSVVVRILKFGKMSTSGFGGCSSCCGAAGL